VQALAAGIEEAQQATVDAFSDLSKSRFANPKFHSLPQNAIDIPRLGVPRRRCVSPVAPRAPHAHLTSLLSTGARRRGNTSTES
jgi:hypothetical protein